MKTVADLTIIILTHRNDQRFIQALRSAQFAKEVYIIDHHSQNDWKKLEKTLHFKRFPIDTLRSFSESRNAVKKVIETAWTFYLDSDEFISQPLQNEIRTKISTNTQDGFYVKRVDAFLGNILQYGETSRITLLRLIRTAHIDWQGSAHEQLTPPDNGGQLHTPLLHIPHQSISEFLTKVNLYTDILSDQTEKYNLPKMIVYPVSKFLWNYFVLQGFRDGMRGLINAFVMSLHSLTLRVKRYEKRVDAK